MLRNLIIALLFIPCLAISQTIRIDGSFEDWDDITPVFIDNTGDGQSNGIDIENVWAYNDQDNLYFRFDLNREINLQENNELSIYVDYDNDINTGFKINGIGAELRFFFGERFGIIDEGNNSDFVDWDQVGLHVSPSVSGSSFELSFKREIIEGPISFEAQPEVAFRIEDNGFNGDEAPDDLAGIAYEIDESNITIAPIVDLSFNSTSEFRFLSYNIENDQLFEASREAEFRRILQSIDPDIIALQEVRDFSSIQTRNKIQEFLPGNWFHKKHGFDIVTISRYPITFSESVDGNAAFYLDVDGKEILLINCHLPCCDNDSDRQSEVDEIMEYIREGKAGNNDYPLQEGTPIIIAGDMNFVGDNDQPNTFLTGDIFNNGLYGPDFMPDWDDSNYKDADGAATGIRSNMTWYNPFSSFFPGKLDWIIYSDSKIKVDKAYNLWPFAMTSDQLAENNLQKFDVLNAADHLPIVADFSYLTVSTDDIVSLDITVYPNPVVDNLFILSKDVTLSSIKILSTGGGVVKSMVPQSKELNYIDVQNLPSGQYYILMESTQGRSIKSFVKR